MHRFTIALLQMTSFGLDQRANLDKGQDFCRSAKRMGADLALFPEMWNTGYSAMVEIEPGGDFWRHPDSWNQNNITPRTIDDAERERWLAEAISLESEFVVAHQELAYELNMAIAITFLEQWEGAPRNTVALIDRHGEIVLTYAKVHTCAFDEPEASITAGNDFPVVELDTAEGPVSVGAMICFDREFPETARILMLNGAEVILTPNACELEINRLAQFRTRAFENMVAVAMTNYAAPQQNGHSIAFHPVASDPDGRKRDLLVVEAGELEGVFLAPFDLDDIRGWREREVWGNAFRRPRQYSELVDTRIQSPFVRTRRDGRSWEAGEH